jgi:hypothetical protein
MKKNYIEHLFLIGFIIVLLATLAVGVATGILGGFLTYVVGVWVVILLEGWNTPISNADYE